jgi:hypothetical protein
MVRTVKRAPARLTSAKTEFSLLTTYEMTQDEKYLLSSLLEQPSKVNPPTIIEEKPEDIYITVPDQLRHGIPSAKIKTRRNYFKRIRPLVEDLIAGKTILIDAQIPIDTKMSSTKYKNLYATMSARGYKLTMVIYDDFDRNIYRGLLCWAEPLVQLWHCGYCGRLEVTASQNKPPLRKCKYGTEFYKNHQYNRVKDTRDIRYVKQSHSRRRKREAV